jgi:hypothetical protein
LSLALLDCGLLPAGARALAAVPPAFLEWLVATHAAGRLQFFGAHANLADRDAFAEYLTPSRGVEWVVYSKRPFGGPEAVLAYLSRYTHRVAISNSRCLPATVPAARSNTRITASMATRGKRS